MTAAETEIAELLRRHDLRVTPQRRAILGAFRGSSEEHLSAEEVLSRASAAVPEIGRGTVYATLAELAELGLLASVGTPEPIRYETNVGRHDHFRCRLCLRLFDVDLGGSELEGRPLDGFTVESVTLCGEGVCTQCNAYARGLADGAEEIMRDGKLGRDALEDLSCLRVDSPFGDITVAASPKGIVRVAFDDHADFPGMHERARARRGPGAARARLKELSATLERYFGGHRGRPADALDLRLVDAEAAPALRAVQEIPYAEPRSYERVMDGLSAYECGRAMGANPLPLLIPCHRVSRGAHRSEAYVGGRERLELLHSLESGAH